MPDRQLTPCKICGDEARLFALVDAGKTCSHQDAYPFGLLGEPVYYVKCDGCGFVFTTHFDDWPVARWSQQIYNSDYGLVDPDFFALRPKANADWLANTIAAGLRRLDVLDFGSGNGKTETFLRAAGFESVSSFDPVFHPVAPEKRFDLVTAFEVVEHSPDPAGSFRLMAKFLKPAALLAFQTSLTPDDLEKIRSSWWYMSPRNGHVSLYSARSLELLAHANGLTFFADGAAGYMYDRAALACGSFHALRLIESFVGWPDTGSDHAVVAEGRWHHAENLSANGPWFRWTAAADGATLVVCRADGLIGTFAVTIDIVMVADGVESVWVRPLPSNDIEVVSSDHAGAAHTFVFRSTGTQNVRFSISTSSVVVPSNGDRRSLGAAVTRPVLRLA